MWDLFVAVFGDQNAHNFCLFSFFFAGHLFIDFGIEISTFGTYKSWFSHGMYCPNRLFMEIVFKELRDRCLVFCGCLGSHVSDFLSLENKFEHNMFFMKKRISSSGSGGASRGGIWAF